MIKKSIKNLTGRKTDWRFIPAKAHILRFRRKILYWARRNRRIYPWRATADPFKVLIAEMMLQRTKANQVAEVYKKFFSVFKNPYDVSKARMVVLRHILEPLGLHWRMRNFRDVARAIVKNFNSTVPSTREELLTLPGVGDYIAGIVLSLAYDKNEWIVDSNVVRVFKRYFGIKTSKEGRRDRHVVEIAKMYASGKAPGIANTGLLDFATQICVPGKAKHHACFLTEDCHYFASLQAEPKVAHA